MNFRRVLGAVALLFLLTITRPLSAQIITNVTPPLGAHGDVVDIFGNGFAPGNQHPTTLSVDFNGVVSTTNPNVVVADSHIQILNVPTTATTGFIHVFINGNEAQSPQQFVVISTNTYVTNFSPIYGAPSTPVTLTGVHFISGGATNVMFNGVLSQKTGTTPFVNSDNSMTVTAPAGVTTGPIVVMSKFGPTHNFSTSNNVITTATNFFVAPGFTSFSPTNGRPGTNIVLTGTNFVGISAIAFGGVSAPVFTISNNTTIRVTVPANASTAKIIVSPPAGTIFAPAQSKLDFRILPTILTVTPTSGDVNTLVTITGSGLNEKSPHPDVTIGGGTVTTFGTISPDTLSFNVPATATSGFITITTTNGTVTSAQLFFLPASIISFTPTNGAAGTLVTITGKNFTNASAVTFNGIPASNFAVANNTTMGATAPAGVTSGPISVTTPFGTTTSSNLFYVAPTIASFTPSHGVPGTTVMISGTSFTNASAVSFNGTPSTSFVVTNNSILSAVVPVGATTGKITVTAPGGTAQSATDFTIDSTDVGVSITDFPDPVFVGSNLVYTITVTNSGATPAANVTLTNTLPLSVTLQSATTTQGTLATNNNPVIGAFGTINNNGSVTVILTVVPFVNGFITNFVSVATTSPDSNLANNTAGIVTTVWPLPFLSITNLMTNGLLQISWPAPLNSFTLQFKGDLANNVLWTNDASARTIKGTNTTVIETNVGTARFFRLTN